MRWSVPGALPGEIFLINKSQVHECPSHLASNRWAGEIIKAAFTHFFLLSSSLLCPAEKGKRESSCSGIKANNKRVSEAFFFYPPFMFPASQKFSVWFMSVKSTAIHPAGRFIANQIASRMQISTHFMTKL